MSNKYQEFLTSKWALKNQLLSEKDQLEDEEADIQLALKEYQEAREIMGAVGILAQDEVRTIIEGLVTKVLQSVFDETYSFLVEDVVARNKPETNFYVVRNGSRFSLKDELGGGVIDIVSFALRIVMWSLASPRTANTIILDEPFKYLDKERQVLAAQLLQELSKELDLQFIIITHDDNLKVEGARFFDVKLADGISEVSSNVI